MQGKEASEQEAKAKSSVGIDVSKDRLDVYVWPSGDRLAVANSREGIRRLKRWLMAFDLGLVVVEATGKWHRQVWRSLFASGIPVATIDPFKARMFAKATGILAKTDRLDAAVLARFAAVMAPPIRPPPPEAIEALGELVAARDAAVAERNGLKKQLSAARLPVLRRQLAARIKRLDADIAMLEREIGRHISADDRLARRYQILISIPSIGTVAAATLIACLAELGSLTDKQAAMLAGLAPIADQSGKNDGKRVVFGGRGRVRRMLYLAAVSAVRWNPPMATFYRRLRDAGKPAKLALIAVARKMVTLANTLIAKDRAWQPTAPVAP
jgi:transposase